MEKTTCELLSRGRPRDRWREAEAVIGPHWCYGTLVHFENGTVGDCEDFRHLNEAITAATDAWRQLEVEG